MECVQACIVCQQPFKLRTNAVFSVSSKPDRNERKTCSLVCHQSLQYCLGLSHGFALFYVLHYLCKNLKWTQCSMSDTSVDKYWTNLPRKISEDDYSGTEARKELQHIDQGEDEISDIKVFFDDVSENEQEFRNECVASSEKDNVDLLTQTPPLACNNSPERNVICKVHGSSISERNHHPIEVQHESNSMLSTKSETESQIHCQFCSFSFSLGDHQGLAEHMCEVHTTQIRLDIICDICGAPFPETEVLRQHKKTDHCINMTRGKSEEINRRKCLQVFSISDLSQRQSCRSMSSSGQTHTALSVHDQTLKASHLNPPMHDGNRLQAKAGDGKRYWCHQCNKTYPTKLRLQRHNQFVHSQQTPVQCGVCGKSFRNKLLLKHHSQFMHSKQMPGKCSLCGKSFRNIHLLKMHTKVAHKVKAITDHRQELSFQCVYCSYTFSESSQDAITNHLAEYHDKTAPPSHRFSCKVCGADFRKKMTLTHHVKQVHDLKDGLCIQTGGKTEKKRKRNRSQCEEKRKSDKKRYPCDKCGKTYTQSALSKHIRIYHTAHKPVDCNFCGKTLINAFHLSQHKRQHVPTKICHICGANFKTDAGLRGHLAAHKGTKSHVCEVCGVGFVRKTSWQRHVKLHTETVHLQCECCPKTFKTVYSLNTHMLAKHHQGVFFLNRIKTLEEVGYVVDKEAISRHLNHQCTVCSTDMVSGGVCPSHPEECKLLFKCNYCQLVLSHVNDLCLHLKKHNLPLAFVASTRNFTASWSAKRDDSDVDYTCQVCHKSFGRRENLAGHMKQHQEKAYECHICLKKFTYKCNMKNHLCTHCEDKPFQCEHCQKAFKSKQLLNHHRLVHNLSESPFKCQVCGKGLTRKSFLQRHYKQMHPGVTV